VSDPTGTTGVSGAAEAGTSAADVLRHQWAVSCDRLVRSLGGLSDEEFRREPDEGCWSVRPDPEHSDRWLMDYPDEVPDPPPFTTISWRLLHVTHGNWIYAEDGFGPGRRTYTDLPIFGNALEAVADLVASQEVVTSVLAAADDASLAHEVSTLSGEPRAAWQVLATLVDEQAHHGAEISLLRDLYRAG